MKVITLIAFLDSINSLISHAIDDLECCSESKRQYKESIACLKNACGMCKLLIKKIKTMPEKQLEKAMGKQRISKK